MARIRSVKPSDTPVTMASDPLSLTPGLYGYERQAVLYRFFGTGMELLYVGVSTNPSVRWVAHRREAPWWRRIRFLHTTVLPTTSDALGAERAAIHAESPEFNKRSRPWRG